MCSGSNAMWCPLGEELIENGFSAGEERLTKVLLFLDKQELTCVDDFVGPHHSEGLFARATMCLCEAYHQFDRSVDQKRCRTKTLFFCNNLCVSLSVAI